MQSTKSLSMSILIKVTINHVFDLRNLGSYSSRVLASILVLQKPIDRPKIMQAI